METIKVIGHDKGEQGEDSVTVIVETGISPLKTKESPDYAKEGMEGFY